MLSTDACQTHAMMVAICKHCSMQVIPTNAGECPSCRRLLGDSPEIEIAVMPVDTQTQQPTKEVFGLKMAVKIKLWISVGYPAIGIVGGVILGTGQGRAFTSAALYYLAA